MADYISILDQTDVKKEAVPGTTLADINNKSYIRRLQKLETDEVDLFICQLSTNDAAKGVSLGTISDSFDRGDFDISTVSGAIEWIISYAKEKWQCPVVFYTNPPFESELYGDMVLLLKKLQQKWDILVIDMWDDAEFNKITEAQRTLYMNDAIHPTRAGYLEWWTPYFEQILYELED